MFCRMMACSTDGAVIRDKYFTEVSTAGRALRAQLLPSVCLVGNYEAEPRNGITIKSRPVAMERGIRRYLNFRQVVNGDRAKQT